MVYRSGGEYLPQHVNRLVDQVVATTPGVRFRLLGDTSMRHMWPKWWGKIELFRGDLWEPGELVVYLDLDTDVIGDLNTLARVEFTMLSDFNRPAFAASGVMAWMGHGPTEVYRAASADPSAFDAYKRFPDKWGDQGFITDHCAERPERFPSGAVVSYKVDCARSGVIPHEAVAIAYHGPPRPWNAPPRWRAAVEEARRIPA